MLEVKAGVWLAVGQLNLLFSGSVSGSAWGGDIKFAFWPLQSLFFLPAVPLYSLNSPSLFSA